MQMVRIHLRGQYVIEDLELLFEARQFSSQVL